MGIDVMKDIKPTNYPPPRPNPYVKYLNTTVLGYVNGLHQLPNKWHDDWILKPLLSKHGVDLHALRAQYSLIPANDKFTYLDVGKYFEPLDDTHLLSLPLRKACSWHLQAMSKVLTRDPHVLALQEVIALIDGSKSATVFLTSLGKKRDVFKDPHFLDAYYFFVRGAINKTVDVIMSASQKEEIRPTDKILQGKGRAFIIASVFHLLLDHQLSYDYDLDWFANWHKADSGIGMSLFNGRYDAKMSKVMDFVSKSPSVNQKKGYYDVGKWDKKLRYALAMGECEVVNSFYERYVPIDVLIPKEYQLPCEVGTQVDTHELRRWVTAQSMNCYVKMPRGEIIQKCGGQPSGVGRTGSGNTGVHKILTYMGAIEQGYETLKSYNDDNISDHTGDDDIFNGDISLFRSTCSFLRDKLGYEIDSCEVEDPPHYYGDVIKGSDRIAQYLSTVPILYHYNSQDWWVPYVDPAKIVSSLAFKSSSINHLDVLQRLLAARVLLRYSEENDMMKAIMSDYVQDNRRSLLDGNVPVASFLWTDNFCDGFYTNVLECNSIHLQAGLMALGDTDD
jgi:hypothetical protein